MPLIALVYCDCVEKGRLLIPHPRPDLLTTDANGMPTLSGGDAEDHEAHAQWMYDQPSCAHEQFILIGGHICDIFQAEWIRRHIELMHPAPAATFPTLWAILSPSTLMGALSGSVPFADAVPFTGVRSSFRGDAVERLQRELHRLRMPAQLPDEHTLLWRNVVDRLKGVTYASLWTGKPMVVD